MNPLSSVGQAFALIAQQESRRYKMISTTAFESGPSAFYSTNSKSEYKNELVYEDVGFFKEIYLFIFFEDLLRLENRFSRVQDTAKNLKILI